MLKFSWFIIPLFLISLDVFAAPKGCTNLKECVDTVGKLTDTKYYYTDKFKGATESSSNVLITKDNADHVLSLFLYENGYARIPVGDKEYKIIAARDIRYQANPHYDVQSGEVGEIPDTHDFVMASIQLKAPAVGTEITRSLRPFLSRYGRVIGSRTGGKIILQDTGTNIRRMIPIIADMDIAPTADELEEMKLAKSRHHEIELAKAKNCVKD